MCLRKSARKKNISDYDELADSIIRDRTILNYNQEAFTLPKVIRTMGALKEGGIKVSADLEKYFSQVAHIAPKNDGVYLQVLKADGNISEGVEVKLDAKTMLMTKK